MSRTCAEYGYGVFIGWSHMGLLRPMAQRHARRGVYGYEKIPEGLTLIGDDAHELATELIIEAIPAFRIKTLMNPDPIKRWRPDGGATLRTFFIGRCLMELPDVYVRWDRRCRRARSQLVDPERWLDLTANVPSPRSTEPHHQAVAVIALKQIAGDHDALLMLRLQDAGYSYAEIAEMFTDAGIDSTTDSVRSKIFRLKQRIQRKNGDLL